MEIALGDELLVGVDDDAARDTELGCQHARGRKRRARRQSSDLHALADLAFEAPAQRPAVVAAQIEEQVHWSDDCMREWSCSQDQ